MKIKNKNRFKEALIVSPAGQTDRSLNEEDIYVPNCTADYENVEHYEVGLQDTGYLEDGILYIDPEIDGTKIPIYLVDENNNLEKQVILDLSYFPPKIIYR